ncbi:FdhF/YdeP family oxidoreductase [Candidatus Gracilibacteria bacterium]|nr:FdhF/YdeP family oxidoreductase [Candidatus Gracilibacteria bacterium]
MAAHSLLPDPSLWASLKPFGIGEQRPNNYLELWKALQENRDNAAYAWRILHEGVCDGCALGTTGLKDWTLDGVHLCNIRLRLLRLNTMSALNAAQLADVAALRGLRSSELRDLGRLPCPMVRRRGDPGFSPLSWEAVLDLIAERIRATTPDRLGFYLTSRGMPNEAYYLAQKAVRAMGTNSIDNAARLCHAPSTVALKRGLGVGASTCSYSDWMESDLLVFVGSNVANNQPVATKYLYHARRNGAAIVLVNNYREPGMERYWIPSIPESALFGTRLAETCYLVNVGGDIAFLNGTLKHLIAEGWIDSTFIHEHSTGFVELAAALAHQPWEELERYAGASRSEMYAFAQQIRDARRAIFVWSMGVTQHEHGEDAVQAIVNLALSKGFVGRAGCGVMPIRGHSGVQGGAEMGAYSTVFPGGVPIDAENAARLAQVWGFAPPLGPGKTTPQMLDAAAAGDLDVLFAVGGNFLEVMPDPDYAREAIERLPLRVHMDIVLSSQMLVEPADTVVLLPATTRYEVPGGVTETTTERRVVFSPEIAGPRIAWARFEGEVFCDLAARVRPELAEQLYYRGTAATRAEIARAIPQYLGIERLERQGDQFQYGGQHLCADWHFPTADGKAHFVAVAPPHQELPDGMFRLTTRRGKQFNSIVHEQRDMLTGAERDAIFMAASDATALGLMAGTPLTLVNEHGRYAGRVFIAPLRPGNLQVHWPEANHLLDRRRRSPQAQIPDYTALVRVEAEAGGY